MGLVHLGVAAGVGYLSTFISDPHAGADRMRDAVAAALVLLTGDAFGLLTRRRHERQSGAMDARSPNENLALPGSGPKDDVTHAMRRNL